MTDKPTTPTLRTLKPKQSCKRPSGASFEDLLQCEPFHPCRAEQAVWRAVLVQMLSDALSRSHKRETRRLKREALDWLSGKGRDFRMVCDYAGYDPSYLHGRVMAMLAAHQVKALPVPLKRSPMKPTSAKADALHYMRNVAPEQPPLPASTPAPAPTPAPACAPTVAAEPHPTANRFSIRLPQMKARLVSGIDLKLNTEESE